MDLRIGSDGPLGKFNPMSRTFVDTMQGFVDSTRENGGATYSPRRNQLIAPDGQQKDTAVIAGAPQPHDESSRFPSHNISSGQFGMSDAEGSALKAAGAQWGLHKGGGEDREYASGSWAPDETHPEHGNVVMDIPDVHPGGPPGSAAYGKNEALATERGEEEWTRFHGDQIDFYKTEHARRKSD